jgi:pimeloyl-ACP methyl ester carboxylesterase
MPQPFRRRAALWLKLARMRLRTARGNRLLYVGLTACGTLLSACGFLPHAHTVPMPALQDRQSPDVRARRLIVMLPGIYDTASDFVREGFVRDLRTRGINADVLMPEAHFGYYEARDIDVRLEADIFAPARAQGYEEIWIVGVSLGGLGSLIYSSQHAGTVTGILMIAPFPGSDSVLGEIRQAGGLRTWAATPQAQGDNERPALRWLAAVGNPGKDVNAAKAPQIFMGTGRSDYLVAGQRLLADALPSANVRYVDGAHDWATWRAIWRDFLDEGPWAMEAAKRAHLDRIRL